MQTLDVISINLWHILISLVNLVLLFFIVKRLLFAPVRRALQARHAALEHQYAAANEAQSLAQAEHARWQSALQSAREQSEALLRDAAAQAEQRAEQVMREAQERAAQLLRQTQQEIEAERRQALEDIRRQIVLTAAALAEKILEREVNAADHRVLIGAFLGELGEVHESRE